MMPNSVVDAGHDRWVARMRRLKQDVEQRQDERPREK